MNLTDLLGLILPPVIDLLNRKVANSSMRWLIATAICLLLAAITNVASLQFGNTEQFLASFGLIFAEAQGVYHLYWNDSGVRKTLNLKG